MISLVRTTSDHADFVALVRYLDAYLAKMDGAEHAFYAQHNKIDKIKHVVVAYANGVAVGCGAMREYGSESMEVKRMYTRPEARGTGVATTVLAELENWARELGYPKCILETGKRQAEAVALYGKNGYRVIPSYGQYVNVENSVCFEKELG